ncbi:MFS transporter [Compostimonas suwonensis]|uniref:Na+/melibiose symporter-like transporter n=1 Tax=Compostimonas suwonensis TaxID=1048394 RepID=A0A2M9BCM1_9MICO|nr:MFS transporter [Compostimonas suwonensis]PJJ55696.1 Na+/melibiose symporter-like transporter [Compostimonas suwonensis]
MSATPLDPTAPLAPVPAPDGDLHPIRSRTGMGRLGVALGLAGFGWVLPFGASTTVLLPAKIAAIDEPNKIALVATITIAGSVIALLANVLFGALSDHTRSRFGRRNPWLIGGGVAAGVFMALLATAESIPMLILWWCLYQMAQNVIIAALVAIVPDRVPTPRRGTISAVYGLGCVVGATSGSILGASFIAAPSSGFLALAVFVIVLPLAAALIAPDFSNNDEPRRKLTRRELFDTFSFPRKAPDYYWALVGRLLIVLGYYMVSGYQLYILTDHMGLDDAAAAQFITLAALVNLAALTVAALVSGPVSDRLGRRKAPVIVASVLIGVGAVFPLIVAEPWTLLVFAVLGGLGMGVYTSVDAALMSEVLPNEASRGKDLGILNMANTGGQILAPFAASVLIGVGFGFTPIFIVAAAVCAVGAFAIAPIKSVR